MNTWENVEDGIIGLAKVVGYLFVAYLAYQLILTLI